MNVVLRIRRARVPIPVSAASGKPSASVRSPVARLSVNSESSYAGRLVNRALRCQLAAADVEYSVEAALEIALTRSVNEAAGFAASADNADNRSVKLCPDEAGSSAGRWR